MRSVASALILRWIFQSWQTLLSLLVYPHCPRYYLPSIVFQQVVRGCESFEASQGYFISLINRVATKVSTIPWFIRTQDYPLLSIVCAPQASDLVLTSPHRISFFLNLLGSSITMSSSRDKFSDRYTPIKDMSCIEIVTKNLIIVFVI